MINPFRDTLNAHLDCIYPGASTMLSQIDEIPTDASRQILAKLLKRACQAQHVGSIRAAHEAMRQLPTEWLSTVLRSAVVASLDLGDEWEYRRLIELLTAVGSDQLGYYVECGLQSEIEDVRDAAMEVNS